MVLKHFKILLFIFLPIISNGQSFHTLMSNYQIIGEAAAFVFTIDTDLGTGDYFKIPTTSLGIYDCTVDWGDLSTSEITSWDDPDTTHYYSVGGEYIITITGTFTAVYFNNTGDKDKLTGVISFGDVGLTNIAYGFYGCANAVGDIPSFPITLNSTGYQGFYQSGFSSVDLTNISTIPFASFKELNFTSDLIIPLNVSSIALQAFNNCDYASNNIHIYIDNVPDQIFRFSTNIGDIYMYNTSISSIGSYCFSGSSINGSVYIYATTAPSISTGSFGFTTTPILHVPVGATGYDSGLWLTEFSSVVYDL